MSEPMFDVSATLFITNQLLDRIATALETIALAVVKDPYTAIGDTSRVVKILNVDAQDMIVAIQGRNNE